MGIGFLNRAISSINDYGNVSRQNSIEAAAKYTPSNPLTELLAWLFPDSNSIKDHKTKRANEYMDITRTITSETYENLKEISLTTSNGKKVTFKEEDNPKFIQHLKISKDNPSHVIKVTINGHPTVLTINRSMDDFRKFLRVDLIERQISDGEDFNGKNLSGLDFSGRNLKGASFSKANFTEANFTGADLTGADLTGADLTGADLTGADLTGADLTGADLTGADLTGADLTGADLTAANLTKANLTKANLTTANLTTANLTDSVFKGVNFAFTNLTNVNRTNIQIEPSDINIRFTILDEEFKDEIEAQVKEYEVLLDNNKKDISKEPSQLRKMKADKKSSEEDNKSTSTSLPIETSAAKCTPSNPRTELLAWLFPDSNSIKDHKTKRANEYMDIARTITSETYENLKEISLTTSNGKKVTFKEEDNPKFIQHLKTSKDNPSHVIKVTINGHPTVLTINRSMDDFRKFLRVDLIEKQISDGVDFKGQDLSELDFSGRNLTGASFSGAIFTGADLTGADLTGADLTGADLTGADLTGADLTAANLTTANLTKANLTDSVFKGVNFEFTNLTNVIRTNIQIDPSAINIKFTILDEEFKDEIEAQVKEYNNKKDISKEPAQVRKIKAVKKLPEEDDNSTLTFLRTETTAQAKDQQEYQQELIQLAYDWKVELTAEDLKLKSNEEQTKYNSNLIEQAKLLGKEKNTFKGI